MRALAKNRRMKLETLVVNSCGFGVEGLSQVVDNFKGSNLDLKRSEIGVEGAKLIRNYLSRVLDPENENQPKSLILSHNPLGDQVPNQLVVS